MASMAKTFAKEEGHLIIPTRRIDNDLSKRLTRIICDLKVNLNGLWVSEDNGTNMHIQGVVFDCDGVLVDSERIFGDVIAAISTEYGFAQSPETVIKRFKGGKLADMIIALFVSSLVQ